jgi:hypothetical protein
VPDEMQKGAAAKAKAAKAASLLRNNYSSASNESPSQKKERFRVQEDT